MTGIALLWVCEALKPEQYGNIALSVVSGLSPSHCGQTILVQPHLPPETRAACTSAVLGNRVARKCRKQKSYENGSCRGEQAPEQDSRAGPGFVEQQPKTSLLYHPPSTRGWGAFPWVVLAKGAASFADSNDQLEGK